MLSLGNLEELTNVFIGNAFFKVYMEIFPNSLEDFNFMLLCCVFTWDRSQLGQVATRGDVLLSARLLMVRFFGK